MFDSFSYFLYIKYFNLLFYCCVPGECSDNVCDLVSCANGGGCFANRADGFICLCPLGFRGTLCEESESQITLKKKRQHVSFVPLLAYDGRFLCGFFSLGGFHRLPHRSLKENAVKCVENWLR